jgi:hypothetical protein
MQKLLIYLVLPLKILCLTSVTIIWEITQIIFLHNYNWPFIKGKKNSKLWTSLVVVEKYEAREKSKNGNLYEGLLKLTNSLQHKTINNFLTIDFKSRLQPYLHVARVGIKKKLYISIRKQLWFVRKEFIK